MLSVCLKQSLPRYFPALFSGLLLTAGFPDPGLYWVSFFALVPLWISLAELHPKQGFLAGLTAGLVHFLTLIYWLVPTLTVYGGLNPYLSVSTLVLLCAYLALYPAFFAWTISTIRVGSMFAPVWGATVWTGLEFVRTHALTGFPWGFWATASTTTGCWSRWPTCSESWGSLLSSCSATGLWQKHGCCCENGTVSRG